MKFNPFIKQRLPFCDINITHSFTYSRMYVKDLWGGIPVPVEKSTVLSRLKIKSAALLLHKGDNPNIKLKC